MIIGVNRETVQRNVLKEMYGFLGFSEPSSKSTEAKLYGHRLYFVGAPDESSVRRIQGSTLACAYVDEATNIPEPLWRMLQSRLRVPGAQLLATCNPEGPSHWLKKDFLDRVDDLDLKYWNFLLDDNPYLTEIYKSNRKKEYTGMWYKRYILGEWAVAHGLIYDGFDHDNTFDKQMDAPNYYICGIDYGTSMLQLQYFVRSVPIDGHRYVWKMNITMILRRRVDQKLMENLQKIYMNFLDIRTLVLFMLTLPQHLLNLNCEEKTYLF